MAIRTIPSLVVGLGGTGKRALTHLKRRILDTYQRDNLPWVRLLSIDTDDGAVSNPPVISQLTGEIVQLGISETRVIDQSDTPKIISNLDAPENRHIKDWYPDPGMNVDFPKAAKGSGQVRMFGRIGLYKGENLYTNYRWLQQAAQEVSDPAAWDEYKGFAIDPGTQFIYVICSLCGGTGSGMFLDIAYMLRKLVGVDPSTRRFVGMLVLPEVYESVVENQHLKRINANTYAALRELDYLMNSPMRSYKIRGKDHTFVDFERDVTPFDFAFLFSNKNKRGAVVSQRQVSSDTPMAADDRIAQYISETIMTDILSPITERNESILSNIFTNIGDPEQFDDRTLHRSYSAVGVSSAKVPPLAEYKSLLEQRIVQTVVDFLLRPDPDVTERVLAKQFINDHLGKVEDHLLLRNSLNNDSSYARFLSRNFLDEFRVNRPACLNNVKQWVEQVVAEKVDPNNPLEIECANATYYKDTLQAFKNSLNSTIRMYCVDPRYGYIFVSEWVAELLAGIKTKQAQVPAQKKLDGDPRRGPMEALDSLQRIGSDMQLPIVNDTVSILVERVADYYDGLGKETRQYGMMRSLYGDLITVLETIQERLKTLVASVTDLDQKNDAAFSAAVSELEDVGTERVLIDKPLVGRREVERFLNFLLTPIWLNGDWKAVVPELSDTMKQRINAELSYRLLEIEADPDIENASKPEKQKHELHQFVKQRVFDELFPIDPATGRLKEPTYADADGKSIVFEFAPENLMQLMLAHSSPLWFVQTHQVASATSPITFLGLNGTKVPEKLMEEMQKSVPTFRPTDVVLSDVEPRIVVKQYDPLYSLASLTSIIDYETFYKNTDRKLNPMHTDVRFVAEPNPYLQWLSYKQPEPPAMKLCARGHDVTRALNELRQFCPDCFRVGIKTFIVPGKIMCPQCQKVIEEGSRKCPECLAILEQKKQYCPGCMAEGRPKPEIISLPKEAMPGGCSCDLCGSLWSDICPYCAAPLEKLTLCTKGSDRCIFDSPPIVLCHACSCPVTPDATKCPRCFRQLKECKECKGRNESRRMIAKELRSCPMCESLAKDVVTATT